MMFDLKATSEFGTLDEHAGPDGDLSELFGPQGPDTIDQFVAYPDWFDKARRRDSN